MINFMKLRLHEAPMGFAYNSKLKEVMLHRNIFDVMITLNAFLTIRAKIYRFCEN